MTPALRESVPYYVSPPLLAHPIMKTTSRASQYPASIVFNGDFEFTKSQATKLLGEPNWACDGHMEWQGADARIAWDEGSLSLETYIGGDEGGWMPLHTEAQAKAALVVIGRME